MDSEVKTQSQESRLEFSMRAVPSELSVTGGRQISLKRAILSMRNTGNAAILKFTLHATVAQEGGSVHDITDALIRTATAPSLPSGETIEWDVYDLLLAAHPGVASKVHLWGYKAILNWWIDLAVWAEFVSEDDTAPLQTTVSRWKLCWTPAHPPLEDVGVSIEAVKL